MNRHIRCASRIRFPLMLGLAAAAAGITCSVRAQQTESPRIEPVAAIRAAAVSFVRAQLPRDANVVEISAGTLDERLRLAHCAAALQAEPTAGGSTLARSTIAVSCSGPVRWRIYVPVTVVRREPVLVLRHAVAREALLTPQDVAVEARRVTGFTEAYLTSPAQLTGRAVRRTLAAGTALTVDMLTPDVVVHRGQDVTLVVETGGIEVRAAGRALQDAAAGARIKVANASSKKIVEGVVESADIVRVD